MVTTPANPLGLLPEGQALLQPTSGLKSRQSGLGTLTLLSDELLNFIFSHLSPLDLVRIERTSRTFYAFARQDSFFKQALLESVKGQLDAWKGSWRSTWVSAAAQPSLISRMSEDKPVPLGLCSDFLFQPALCAGFDPNSIYAAPTFKPTLPYVDARTLQTADDLPKEACILQHAMDDWPAYNPPSDQPERKWTLANLALRCPSGRFRAEAVLSTLSTYASYAANCATEDTPSYLFDSEFCSKAAQDGVSLEDDFRVPPIFTSDLFKVLKEQRPDYRWLIVGPARSGSTFHKDPNHTSAWNAVTSGSKAWIVFPEDVQPPGVQVSEDEAQVSTPDSVAEWFVSYYKHCKAVYGPNGKDPSKRGTMKEGICREGEIFYVPSRCWHLVINLEETVALTQNFVGERELANVLYFMKHRPDQVSGFKKVLADGTVAHEETDDDPTACAGENEKSRELYEQFCAALKREGLESALLDALKKVGQMEVGMSEKAEKVSLWDRVREGNNGSNKEEESEDKVGEGEDGRGGGGAGGGFSFGFDLDDTDEDDNEEAAQKS